MHCLKPHILPHKLLKDCSLQISVSKWPKGESGVWYCNMKYITFRRSVKSWTMLFSLTLATTIRHKEFWFAEIWNFKLNIMDKIVWHLVRLSVNDELTYSGTVFILSQEILDKNNTKACDDLSTVLANTHMHQLLPKLEFLICTVGFLILF